MELSARPLLAGTWCFWVMGMDTTAAQQEWGRAGGAGT